MMVSPSFMTLMLKVMLMTFSTCSRDSLLNVVVMLISLSAGLPMTICEL